MLAWKRCPGCDEPGDRAHMQWCEYAPNEDERNAYIREHAVGLVRGLEAKVRRQAKEIAKLNHRLKWLQDSAAGWANMGVDFVRLCWAVQQVVDGGPTPGNLVQLAQAHNAPKGGPNRPFMEGRP